jgi:hypothetical protein
MSIVQHNYIACDVKITIVRYSSGLLTSFFNHSNPFFQPAYYQPLPLWDNINSFEQLTNKAEHSYWIVEEELIMPPVLDLKKTFNCFNRIPSSGAQYSIKLCVDVPNNKKPLQLSPQTGSETGHTFVVIKKTHGGDSVIQVFGFYAQKHPGYGFPFRPMPSTINNNQLREINASIEMVMSPQQFEELRKKALELAKKQYAAVDYNCTNYSLDLFNSIRQNPIITETYPVYLPGNQNIWGTSKPQSAIIDRTPQKLFKKLQEMKGKKDEDASCIELDLTGKTIAPLSHGECD